MRANLSQTALSSGSGEIFNLNLTYAKNKFDLKWR